MIQQSWMQKIEGRQAATRGIAKPRTWGNLLLAVLLALLISGTAAAPLAAQITLPEGVTADEVNEVARELWCPLCNGVRLDGCELKACDQMKDVIAIKLAEGEDVDSIRDYFVAQYGPQVLGEPPREGFNWLAWILPVVAVVGGGVYFWRKTQSMIRPAQDREVVAAAPPATGEDDYERKLEEELAKYG